jgi:DNA gyrase inhibitor GyrI
MWDMKLLRSQAGVAVREDFIHTQNKTIKFPELTAGTYVVELVDPFTSTAINLGSVDIEPMPALDH